MSTWSDSDTWAKYRREGCLVCNQTPESRPPAERTIAELSVSQRALEQARPGSQS